MEQRIAGLLDHTKKLTNHLSDVMKQRTRLILTLWLILPTEILK